MANLKLLTDQALGEGDLTHDLENYDGLNFTTYAKILGDAALGSSPLTIGVFGEWGSGKTSLMRMIESYLKKKMRPELVVVWFNAWCYEQEIHPIVSLIASIVKELEYKKSFIDTAKDKLDAMIRSLRAAAYGFSTNAKIQVPGFAEVGLDFSAKDMIEREKALTPDPLLDRSLYYEAFEKLSEISGDFGQDASIPRIVVLVDDLDRCFPDRAIHLLESIKLVLAQPGFVLILGVARKVIEGYLEHRYGQTFGITDSMRHAHSYLDKIIQLPFHVPPHRSRITAFAKKKMENIGLEPEEQNLVLPVIVAASENNPRTVVRFVNNLLIDQRINEAIDKEKIPLEYFAVTLCLQQRWPDQFERLINSPSLCEEIARYPHGKQESDDIDVERRDAIDRVRQFIASNQELENLLKCDAGKNWLNDHNTRDATVEFLQLLEPEEEQVQRFADENDRRILADKQMAQLHQILPDWKNSLGMKFVVIPAGQFIMGLENGSSDEKPPHRVTISKPFSLGVYLVTQKEFQLVMNRLPDGISGQFKGADKPIINVSWHDAQEFIDKLNEKEKNNFYRLPTEAEWEYACRAGSTTSYFWGDDETQLARFSWYDKNSSRMPKPVGQKEANPWGLFDMIGNVREWCSDWYGSRYYQESPEKDPTGPSESDLARRVRRGGSWTDGMAYQRSSVRSAAIPDNGCDFHGFRLACSPKSTAPEPE